MTNKTMSSAEITEAIHEFGLADKIVPPLQIVGEMGKGGITPLLTPVRTKRKNEEYLSSNESKKSAMSSDDVILPYSRMAEVQVLCFIHREHPRSFITKDGAKLIQSVVNSLIDEEPVEGTEIKVQYCKVLEGGIEFGCADQATVNWLKRKVKEVEAKATVKLTTTDKMVLPFVLVSVRVDYDIADQTQPAAAVDEKQFCIVVLRRLKKQNRTYSIKDWVIIDTRKTDRGRDGLILKIRVPLADAGKLKTAEGCLYYQSFTLKVSFLGDRDEKRVRLGE